MVRKRKRRRYISRPSIREYVAGLTRQHLTWVCVGLAGITLIFLCVGVFVPRHPFASGTHFFEIKAGEGLRRTAAHLAEQGVISSGYLFRVLGRLRRADTKIKAGEYLLRQDQSSWRLLSHLLSGEVFLHRFTAPEGASAAQIAAELKRRDLVDGDEFLRLVREPAASFASALVEGDLEGYLFPDTYRIPRGISAAKMIEMMLGRFCEKLPLDFAARAKQLGLRTKELVILASIVEKETKAPEELPLVAAVFYNRLKKKMRLESCATVNYVIGHQRRRLRERDLAVRSPYNTYLQRGLPPGAICNPGIGALVAASHPARVEYLYFVSRGDGRHEFSVDYQGHLAAKRKYQK